MINFDDRIKKIETTNAKKNNEISKEIQCVQNTIDVLTISLNDAIEKEDSKAYADIKFELDKKQYSIEALEKILSNSDSRIQKDLIELWNDYSNDIKSEYKELMKNYKKTREMFLESIFEIGRLRNQEAMNRKKFNSVSSTKISKNIYETEYEIQNILDFIKSIYKINYSELTAYNIQCYKELTEIINCRAFVDDYDSLIKAINLD